MPSREELLRAAYNKFAALGFEGVSLRKLGAELGVSDSLFNQYFGSKEELWYEAVDSVLRPAIDPLQPA